MLTLRSEPLCPELLLGIVIMYLYNAANRQNLFHIHLHKAVMYCLRVEIDMYTHRHADEIVKQSPPIATPNPSTHPAFTVDSPAHLSLGIAKKQGTICHSVCKCDHPLCHLKYTRIRTHTYAQKHSDTATYTYI